METKEMLVKYNLVFFEKNGSKYLAGVDPALGSVLYYDHSLSGVNQLLEITKGVLYGGENAGAEIPLNCMALVIISPDITKIYNDDDAWYADNNTTPDYVLPTADFKILVESWRNYLAQ